MKPSGKAIRIVRVAGILLGLLLCCALIYLLRPPCKILDRTGLYCAGCGTQRMITALLQGDFPGAFAQNPLMLILLPLAGIYLLAEAVRYVQEKPLLIKRKGLWAILLGILALSIVFMILRNLPGFRFLGPV